MTRDLESWLRERCERYRYDLRGVLRAGPDGGGLSVQTADELEQALLARGDLLPLPKEPAALANILEVSIVDYILRCIEEVDSATATRGGERAYPDLEVSGTAFGGGYHAVDIKVAQYKILKNGRASRNTQSRITLYTGNTYFSNPQLKWPGVPRPFADYSSHLDVIALYVLNVDLPHRVDALELLVAPSWTIASKERSSTTREYIGAVTSLEDLRQRRGEFSSEEEFYKFWRKYRFKSSRQVEATYRKLMSEKEV